jgi:F0F1-type ATP synthase membrane subunit b/b'
MRSLRKLRVLVAVAAWSALPGLAMAAEHGEGAGHSPGPGSLGWYWVNFALLLVLLVWKGRPPMNTFLEERKENALAELRAAERMRDEARARLAELEAKVTRVETDVRAILDETLRLAEAERDRILAGAEEAAKRIQSQATLMVEQEVRRARSELSREVTESASREAVAILRNAFSDSDQDRLIREFTMTERARS